MLEVDTEYEHNQTTDLDFTGKLGCDITHTIYVLFVHIGMTSEGG